MQGTLTISMQDLDYAIQHEYDVEILRADSSRRRRKDNGFRCSKRYGELLDLVSLCSKVYGYIQSPLDNKRDEAKAKRIIKNKKSKKELDQRCEDYRQRQRGVIESTQTNHDKSDGWILRRAKRVKSTPEKKSPAGVEYNKIIDIRSSYGVVFSIPKASIINRYGKDKE